MRTLLIIISLVFTTLQLFSYNQSERNNTFTINGSFNAPQNEEWIYLGKFMDNISNVDSTRIIDGKFTFTGKIKIPEVYYISYKLGKDINGVATFFIESGNIDLVISPFKNWYSTTQIKGGKVNSEYQKLEGERIEKYVKTIWKLNDQLGQEGSKDSKIIKDSIEKLWSLSNKFELDYINNHPKSPVSLFMYSRKYKDLSISMNEKILKNFDPSLHQSLVYLKLTEKLKNQIDIQKKNIQLNENINFQQGSIVKTLREKYPNKILYLNLWSTTCGPCLNELTYYNDLYRQIDTNKVSMIHLCTFSNVKNWKNRIKSDAIQGQHFILDSDLADKLFKELNTPTYCFAIINKDGDIITNDAPPSSEKTVDILKEIANK